MGGIERHFKGNQKRKEKQWRNRGGTRDSAYSS